MGLADDIINGKYKKKKVTVDVTSKNKEKLEKINQNRQASPSVQQRVQTLLSTPQTKNKYGATLIDNFMQQNNTDKIQAKRQENALINKDFNTVRAVQPQTNYSQPKKNSNIWQDIVSLTKLTSRGGILGGKQTMNYIESSNENNFNNYASNRRKQFYASPNVNELAKSAARFESSGVNNRLNDTAINNIAKLPNVLDVTLNKENKEEVKQNIYNQINKYRNTNGKIETNLIKKSIRDSINRDEQLIQEEQQKLSNKVTKRLGEIAPSMGQMIPGTALSAVNPILGTSYFITSAGGEYLNDALNRGMNDKQAYKYATIMAGLEGGSEAFITGQQVNKVLKSFGGKQISKNVLNSYGFNIFENAVQEAVMEPAQEITAGIVGDKADWTDMGSRIFNAGFNGALMGGISNGVTYGLTKSGNVYNKIQNGEKVSPKEYAEALKENINKFGKNKVEQAIKQGAVETYQEIEKVSHQNETAQPQSETMQDLKEKIDNSNLSEETKQSMVEDIDKGIDQEQYNKMRELIDNSVENNQEMLYNTNESESGINEDGGRNQQNDKRRVQELLEKYRRGEETTNASSQNTIKEQSGNKKITEEETKLAVIDYANKYQKTQLNENEKKLKAIINNLNGNVVFYEFGDNNIHQGLADTATFYIDSLGNEKIENVFYHEITHYLRQNNNEIYNKEIQPIVEDLATNFENQDYIYKYALSNEDFDVRKLDGTRQFELAEEVLADNVANIYGDLEIDYKLDEDKRNQIKQSMDKIFNQPQNSNQSSFNMPTKQQPAVPTQNKVQVDNNNTIAEGNKPKKITRRQIQEQLLEDSGIFQESLDKANNKSMLTLNRTDPIRLQEKVFGEKLGDKINETFFRPIKHNTAEKTRFLNNEREDIKSWGIKARSLESEVLQKFTEKSYVNQAGEEAAYTEKNLNEDIADPKTREKIKEASKQLREKYDNYIDKANEVLTDLGYDPIPKRKDYVRHFIELNDIFTKFGIPAKFENALPTDINGITDQFRPGKNFFANAQRRYGNKTTYDAITGIDGYIEGIGNLIYHTEDIQKLRAFDRYIRETYGQKGFENLDNLSQEEKTKRIENIQKNHLSNYVSWLTEYTNNLAGKKSGIDRSVEKLLGRNIYSALDTMKKQTGSNMTGLNIGSALTNFISVTQAASKTKKLSLLKGTADTINNIFNNDGFINKSDFLTNRFGSDRISNNLWQKVSNAGQVFMNATDYFSSNVIVRSKYYENLAKGMNEQQAIKNADDFGARILGDRSQGATANVFNSKMLGIATQFQLEVNNQMDTMIHDTIMDFKNTSENSNITKASMGAVWTLGQMAVYQYAFNNIYEAIVGRRPAFDIIDVIKTAFGLDDDDDDKDSVGENLQQSAKKLIEALPFANLMSENARIPVTSAVPNPISIATGDSTLGKEASKLVYLLPPTGGSQIKKSIEGIKTVKEGGSYITNSKGEKELRFPVENASVKDYAKATAFGKYSLPLAKEYEKRGYKRLTAKQTEIYEETKIPFKEFLNYIDSDLKSNKDKIDYLNSTKMTEQQKWNIYVKDILSKTERKDGNGSQVEDAKYITSNGVSKKEYMKCYELAQKNNIDMPTADEYNNIKESGVSLENYIEFKTKIKETTKQKKASGELKEGSQLPDGDKIELLLNSNYSDKQKTSIYESVLGEKDNLYKIIKNSDININEYLEYKTQWSKKTLRADRDAKGNTISGTAKKKVYNYIENNVTGYENQLLLKAYSYKLEDKERAELSTYINEISPSYEDAVETFKKLYKNYKYINGKIYYQ